MIDSRASVHSQLAIWADEFSRYFEPVSTHTRMGIPPREIVRLAAELSVDLIVLGTRGRTSLKHVLLGSVAENVIKIANCPVLIVRAGKASEGRFLQIAAIENASGSISANDYSPGMKKCGTQST